MLQTIFSIFFISLLINQVISQSPNSWLQLSGVNAPSFGRTGQASIYVSNSNIMLVFGGWSSQLNLCLNDLWQYNISSNTWLQLNSTNVPSPRYNPSTIYVPNSNTMLLYAGWLYSTSTYFNDLWQYNISSNTWLQLNGTNAPTEGRYSATVFYLPNLNAMLVYGGSYLTDLWQYNISSNTWLQLNGTNAPTVGTTDQNGVYVPNSNVMLIYAGLTQSSEFLNTLWQYNISSNMWLQLNGTNAPTITRSGHNAVYLTSSNVMLIYGGYSPQAGYVYDLWQYNISSNSWVEILGTNAPEIGRVSYYAAYASIPNIWLIYGGNSNNGNLNDLWAYYILNITIQQTTQQQTTQIQTTQQQTTQIQTTEQDTTAELTTNLNHAITVSPHSSSAVGIGVGIGIGVGVPCCLILIILIIFLIIRQKQKKNQLGINEVPLKAPPSSPPYAELEPSYGPIADSSQGLLVRYSRASLNSNWIIKYEDIKIERELGKGAYGVVYLGEFRMQKVAVKKIFNLSTKNQEDFEAEAELLMKLRPHENIVTFYGITLNPLSIVTGYLSNGSVSAYLKSALKVEFSTVVKWGKEITKGMHHLHSEGVIHRDLAARNLLLDAQLTIKISDFGMSRVIGMDQQSDVTSSTVGPVKWMAPECITKRIYSKSTDVYAFAITMIEILTWGSNPYPNYDNLQIALEVVQNDLRPDIPGYCDEALKGLIQSCWNKDPDQRPMFDQIYDWLVQYEKNLSN